LETNTNTPNIAEKCLNEDCTINPAKVLQNFKTQTSHTLKNQIQALIPIVSP